MAYVSKELKAKLTPGIKEVLKKYGVKGSISVNHHSTLVVTISEGKLDFMNEFTKMNFGNAYIDVNVYYIEEQRIGESRNFLLELKQAMKVGNRDNSDPMTDYFDIGRYIDINVGKYDKPYKFLSSNL